MVFSMKHISEYCCKTFDPLIVNESINYIQRLLILTNIVMQIVLTDLQNYIGAT